MADSKSFGEKFLEHLTNAGLAAGQGLTAAGGNEVPYYTDYLNSQAKQAEIASKTQDNNINAMKAFADSQSKNTEDYMKGAALGIRPVAPADIQTQLKAGGPQALAAFMQNNTFQGPNGQRYMRDPSLSNNFVQTGVGADGNPTFAQAPGKVVSAGKGPTDQDIKGIGDAIISGKQPPVLTGLYGSAPKVKAYLATQGYDLASATKDWTASQQLTKSMNGTQQLRLGQAVNSVQSSIPVLREVSTAFDRSGWTPANMAELKAAMTGTDPTKRDIATKYVTQINLMKDELGQAFMGGGVPTDKAFGLADDILKPAYGVKQLNSGLDQLERNLNIRLHAISSVAPQVAGSSKSSTTASKPAKDSLGLF